MWINIIVSLFYFVLTLTFGPTSIFFYINTFEVSDHSDLTPLQSSHAGSSANIYYDTIFPRLIFLTSHPEPNKLFQEGILKTGAKAFQTEVIAGIFRKAVWLQLMYFKKTKACKHFLVETQHIYPNLEISFICIL